MFEVGVSGVVVCGAHRGGKVSVGRLGRRLERSDLGSGSNRAHNLLEWEILMV
jgi:hypothetical protein